jgi:hypothetical protein
MIIRYGNGFSLEATLLSRTDELMRVGIDGSDNVLHLTLVNGTWTSDDGEPVHIEFAYARLSAEQVITEHECLCSHEFASTLINLLFAGEDNPGSVPAPPELGAPVSQVV